MKYSAAMRVPRHTLHKKISPSCHTNKTLKSQGHNINNFFHLFPISSCSYVFWNMCLLRLLWDGKWKTAEVYWFSPTLGKRRHLSFPLRGLWLEYVIRPQSSSNRRFEIQENLWSIWWTITVWHVSISAEPWGVYCSSSF
jgi:hypothetical protein